jgi:hypothetical protein
MKENEESQNEIKLLKIDFYEKQTIEIYDTDITPSDQGIFFTIETLNQFFLQNYLYLLELFTKNITDGSIEGIEIKCWYTLFDSTYNCSGNLTDRDKGHTKIVVVDQCKKQKELSDINIVDSNSQRLKSITPNFININEKKDNIITLNYNQNFDENPIKVAFVNKEDGTIANNKNIDISSVNGTVITFTVDKDFIINPGRYYIKLIFENQENEIISSETILFGGRLVLYENKQKLVVTDLDITRIGVIFTNDISESQI